LVKGDNQVDVPVGLQEVESHGVMGFVEGGHADGIVHEVDGFVEGHESGDRVMSSGISEAEEQRQLGGVVYRIGGEFVEGMSVDKAIVVGIVSPMGFGVFEPSRAGAFSLTVTWFVTVGIGPGRDLGAVSSDAQVFLIDQTPTDGRHHSQGMEERVDTCFQVGESQMVGMLLDVLSQLMDDPLMLWGIGVLVFGLSLGVLFLGAGSAQVILGALAGQSGFEVEEGTDPWHLVGVKTREDGVVRDRAHGGHPLIDRRDLTGLHQDKRAHHVLRGDSRSSLGGTILRGHHRSQGGQVQLFNRRIHRLMMKGNHLDVSQMMIYKLYIVLMST
jgi:hypothetical protein